MNSLKTPCILSSLLLALVVFSSGCTEDSDGETNEGSETNETNETSETSEGSETSETNETSEMNEEVEALKGKCPTLETRADCSAVPSVEDKASGTTYSCSWSGWVPVSLDGDMCVFGEPYGTCLVRSFTEVGCAGGTGYRTAGGSVELATSESCFPSQACNIDPVSGEVYEGPAECACLISDEYKEL